MEQVFLKLNLNKMKEIGETKKINYQKWIKPQIKRLSTQFKLTSYFPS